MLYEKKIWFGTGVSGPAFLLPEMAVRHGIISGATGSGKTVCAKLLAEGFSLLGIPVFMTDVKGDLSAIVRPGQPSERINRRLADCGVDPGRFEFRGTPTIYWDAFGESGHPLRTSVANVDPLLMARLLDLKGVQAEILEIVYRICQQEGYYLEDLKDLRATLLHIGKNINQYSYSYGHISPQSISVYFFSLSALPPTLEIPSLICS